MVETGHTYSDELVGDLHKDARGFRPGYGWWMTWRSSTPAQRQTIWDGLIREMEESERRELDMQARAADKFEELVAQITNVAKEFNRTDVVRCLHDAYGTNGDIEQLEYRLGLPYGYITKTLK